MKEKKPGMFHHNVTKTFRMAKHFRDYRVVDIDGTPTHQVFASDWGPFQWMTIDPADIIEFHDY